MSDRYLLERFVAANDPEAFRTLIEVHGEMVLAVCRGTLRDAHAAEDAFQDTFMTLARRAASIRQSDCIGPWLHRVAVRTARCARWKANKRRAHEGTLASALVADRSSSPPDLSFVPALHEEMVRLPDHYRLPLVLCYLEGKSNQDAAQQLGCPVGTIKGRLSRARHALRDRMRRRGVDSH
jgi:RNA polymerase sigma factor (sigma-70 family)